MAVPTFSTVTPTAGHPTGGQFVEVTGTNFQLPPAPPATGVVPVAPPTVRVLFGAVEATKVSVLSATRLFVFVPKRALPVDSNGQTQDTEVVSLTIENIDTNGDLIPGETVTVASAYTYRRPDVSGQNQTPFAALIRHLLQLLKSEVTANVLVDVNTDYDTDTATTRVDPAEVPSVVLTGPTMTANTLYTDNARSRVTLTDANEFYTKRRPYYCDLTFDVIVITQSTMHLYNLMSLITTVVDRNPQLFLDCGAPVGIVPFDLNWAGPLGVVKQSNQLNSNIRVAKGSFTIVGFPFDTITGTSQDAAQEVGHVVEESPIVNTLSTA
jgi:hypothetical protein